MNTIVLSHNPYKITEAKHDHELIAMWLMDKSPATQRQYIYTIRQFFNFLENKAIASINHDDLKQWKKSLEGLSQNTVKSKLAVVKSLFSYASSLGYCHFNVAKSIKSPKAQDTLTERILTKSDVKAIVNNPDSKRNKLFIKTIYLLGLRVSEVVNLKWSDVLFTDEGIKIKVNGKGNKIRYLIIPNSLYNELLSLRKTGNDFIFVSRQGTGKLSRKQAYNIVRKNSENATNKKASPHYLRHSHATHALNNGCNIEQLSKDLGHGDIAITSRYIHVSGKDCSSNYLDV